MDPERLDLTLGARAVIGLGGPSGIGKSTLACVLTGLLEPQARTVTVNGRPQS